MPLTTLSAFHPSPKRKRGQPTPPIPLINTALRPASTPSRDSTPATEGADSPRNAVAEQLKGMTLTSVGAIPLSPLTPTDDVERKKPKLEGMRLDIGTSLDETSVKKRVDMMEKEDKGDGCAVISGKMDLTVGPQAQTQPRIPNANLCFVQPTVSFTFNPNTVIQSSESSSSRRSTSKSRTLQPRQRKKSPSPPLSSLTWQDSEITGHLAGPNTDPDDDGTGLNGVGFRPTPAVAYARAQKRRQQVLDWKAREAREARAKRSERRRRGVGGTPSREASVSREVPTSQVVARRTVKFAV